MEFCDLEGGSRSVLCIYKVIDASMVQRSIIVGLDIEPASRP